MARRSIFIGRLLVASAAAFGVTSYALGSGSEPRLRPNLPAGQLPARAVSDPVKIAMSNLLGRVADRYGISDASYAQVREIAQTSVGTLYLVPGSRGACVVLRNAASCGDPGSVGETVLALVVRAPSDVMVGGGVTTDTVHRVTIAVDGGPSRSFAAPDGVFVVSEAAQLDPDVLAFYAER